MIGKKQRDFHVSYQWKSQMDTGFGFGSITISMTGKLTRGSVQEMRKYIDSEHPGQKSIIIAITELEK